MSIDNYDNLEDPLRDLHDQLDEAMQENTKLKTLCEDMMNLAKDLRPGVAHRHRPILEDLIHRAEELI